MSLVRSCGSRLPAKVLFARQDEFELRIREASRSQRYNAALINGGDMLWALDALPPNLPTVLIAHNLEHQVLAQQVGNSRLLSKIFTREINKQRQYEIEGFRHARGVIFLSTTDMAWGCSQAPGLRALHLPPLFPEPSRARTRQPSGQLHLGFLADFAWWPNRIGWRWLVNEVLSKVDRPVTIHLFGRQSDRMPVREGVVAHGFVHQLSAVWNEVDFMICPILTGAGVNIKLAESLYHRMPVLATSQALRGLDCASGPGLMIIDRSEDWASFLNSSRADLLATQTPSEELRRQFTADEHLEKLEHFILEVALSGGATK